MTYYTKTNNNEITEENNNLRVHIVYVDVIYSEFNCNIIQQNYPTGGRDYTVTIELSRADSNSKASSKYNLTVEWENQGFENFIGNLPIGETITLTSTKVLPSDPGTYTITVTGNCGTTEIILDVQEELVRAFLVDELKETVFITSDTTYLKYI